MRKLFSCFWGGIAISCILLFSGCHSGNAVATASYAVPTSVSINPTPSASLELGKTLQFFSSANNSSNQTISGEPIEFASSNQAVVTVAANGLACAGIWDS